MRLKRSPLAPLYQWFASLIGRPFFHPQSTYENGSSPADKANYISLRAAIVHNNGANGTPDQIDVETTWFKREYCGNPNCLLINCKRSARGRWPRSVDNWNCQAPLWTAAFYIRTGALSMCGIITFLIAMQ